MRATFRHRRFKVIYSDLGELDGNCLDETEEIEIDKKIKGKCRLTTELHEALHACLPMLKEKIIDRSSTDIAKFLWKLGYRLRKGSR